MNVDNTAPLVTLTTAPANKSHLHRSFKVGASAWDHNGIADVQLLINGKVVATDTTAGYSFTVNPTKYAKYGKTFTVEVRAYDKAGNLKNSTIRTYYRS